MESNNSTERYLKFFCAQMQKQRYLDKETGRIFDESPEIITNPLYSEFLKLKEKVEQLETLKVMMDTNNLNINHKKSLHQIIQFYSTNDGSNDAMAKLNKWLEENKDKVEIIEIRDSFYFASGAYHYWYIAHYIKI